MALRKKTNFKGIDAEYWKIFSIGFNAFENITTISMGLYLNLETRNENINNFLDVKIFSFQGEYTRPQAYEKIKESKLETIITTGYQEQIVDSDGNIIQEEIQEVSYTNETNEFANCEDC